MCAWTVYTSTTTSVSLSWLWEAKYTHNDCKLLLLFHVLQTTVAANQPLTNRVGCPFSSIVAETLHLLIELCAHLGIPLAVEKVKGPSTCLPFLGIEIDSVAQELRLLVEQLPWLLNIWERKTKCTQKELQSLAGHLQHAASMVCPGHYFIRYVCASAWTLLVSGKQALTHVCKYMHELVLWTIDVIPIKAWHYWSRTITGRGWKRRQLGAVVKVGGSSPTWALLLWPWASHFTPIAPCTRTCSECL